MCDALSEFLRTKSGETEVSCKSGSALEFSRGSGFLVFYRLCSLHRFTFAASFLRHSRFYRFLYSGKLIDHVGMLLSMFLNDITIITSLLTGINAITVLRPGQP